MNGRLAVPTEGHDMKRQYRDVTTVDIPARDIHEGQTLAEVDGERLHRGPLRRWYCQRRNRQLINGFPVVTKAEWVADGEGGKPTVYIKSSELPGLTWCLDPDEIVKVVAS